MAAIASSSRCSQMTPGEWAPRARAHHLVGRDDDVDAEVVLGLGQLLVDELEPVDRRDDRRRVVDEPGLGQQHELEVGEPAALAEPDALAVDRDRPADDEVDVPEVLDARRDASLIAFLIVGSDCTRTNGLSSRRRGTAMYSVLPSRRARRRTGSCGASGLDFTTSAACHSGSSASRCAAASAPLKFGMRPRAPGNRAAPWSWSSCQTRSRTSCLSSTPRP